MSNLPILYFTLGALAGLPLGYWLGWALDPERLLWRFIGVLIGLHRLEESALLVWIAAMDGEQEVRA